MLGIDEVYEGRYFMDLSKRDIYVRRANKGGGMYLPNALEIACNHGSTLEELVPSELKHEADMNKWDGINEETDKIAEKYKAKGYLSLPINIDSIANITSQGKGVLLGFRFDAREWTTYPTIVENAEKTIGHGVCAVDNILIEGKKYLVIDDSWGFKEGKGGQRFISEEFLKARCFYAGYTINLIYGETEKPKHKFTITMKVGDKNNEVKCLQDCLKYEGLFPINTESTGFYGNITRQAVRAFQFKYKVASDEELTAVNGMRVGIKTLLALNNKFN